LNTRSVIPALCRLNRFDLKVSSVDGLRLHGIGEIDNATPDEKSVIFKERGFWNVDQGPRVTFRNAYQWSVLENTLSLARYGYDMSDPNHLVDFEISKGPEWPNISPYICGRDTYDSTLRWSDGTLRLLWIVSGPKKEYTVEYLYS
jgi:hypothetical protein